MKTINLWITMLIMLFTSVIGVAQYQTNTIFSDERNTLQFGIKVGINNSNVYDARGEDFVANPIIGPVFGGFLSVPLCTVLGIQPEILYSSKGYAGSGAVGPQESSSVISTTTVKGSSGIAVTGAGGGIPDYYSFINQLNYIDIPIMLQLKILPGIYLLGGLEYSYLLSRTYTFTNGVTTETTQQQFQNDNIRRNVFGVIAGIDLNLNRKFTLGGRVAWDEADNNGDGTSTMPQYRNYWGQATLGYRF
jgi:hypothetical protein